MDTLDYMSALNPNSEESYMNDIWNSTEFNRYPHSRDPFMLPPGYPSPPWTNADLIHSREMARSNQSLYQTSLPIYTLTSPLSPPLLTTPVLSPLEIKLEADSNDELSQLVSDVPEILDVDRSFPFTSFNDILLDLESNAFTNSGPWDTLPTMPPCNVPETTFNAVSLKVEEEEDIPLWGGKCFLNRKRTLSEDSEDLPMMPTTSMPNPHEEDLSLTTPSPAQDSDIEDDLEFSDNEKSLNVEQFRTATNYDEHNYSKVHPSQLAKESKASDEDVIVDVESCVDLQNPIILEQPSTSVMDRVFVSRGLLFNNSVGRSTNGQSSQNVKRQLKQSITNKQTKRVGRPSTKNVSAAVLSGNPIYETIVASDTAEVRIDSTVPVIRPNQHNSHGKPAAYTERMRQLHAVVPETTSGRGTSAPKTKRRKHVNDPEDNITKRINHNSMERQRRIDIRKLFDELRSLLPQISNDKRASKVQILDAATKACDEMQRLESTYNSICSQHEEYKTILSNLKRNGRRFDIKFFR